MNILMVDDMCSVVNGMEKSINWEKLEITGVYKAYNAYEAKILLSNLKIDILMTDIEMPGENGLDLVEWVRSQNLDIECIIISSHANFDYARRAMTINSFQYVLLPCPYKEIEDVVGKAVETIKRKRKVDELKKYGEMMKKDDWIDDLLFEKCLSEHGNKEAVQHVVQALGIKKETEGYLCVTKITDAPGISEQFDEKLLAFIFHNVIAELADSWNEKIMMHQVNRETYLFYVFGMNTEACRPVVFQKQIKKIEETFKQKLHMDLNTYFEYSCSLDKLPEAYSDLKRKSKALASCYEENEDSEQYSQDIIHRIEIYVRDHIAQDIKRSEVSEMVHLNIDYLARIFKKNTGMTLNDYIINEKMAMAKNYITTTRLPISLIATKVGYYNFSYFSKLYKKTYGKTPSEERI